MRREEGCFCVRGALPECAENGSCIPEAPRSWGVGAWGVGRAGSGGETRSPWERKEALQRFARALETSPGARGGRRLQPAAPARGESRGAAGRPGARARPPPEEQGARQPARCGVGEQRGSCPLGGREAETGR